MSVEVFHGTWKIVECVNISNSRLAPPAEIDGAIFVLQENGEIRWDLSPPTVDKEFPLFQCDCYEVIHTFVGVCIQMGAVSGHMFEFWIDRPIPRDLMLLTFEGWCMIQCQQINAIQPPLDFPFSFLPAFTDGYFSDLEMPPIERSLVSAPEHTLTTKGFKIHSVVMDLSNAKIDELYGLPNDVLETVLHFLYTQSLPLTLSNDTANRCITMVPESMADLIQLCRDYLHRTCLKQKIVKLVNEVHSCAESMTAAFQENSVTNPSRFCYVIKLALRYAAVAFMKLVELCVLYGEEAPLLNRNERLEILRYAKTRLPIFLTQFVALLRNIKSDFSTVKPADRNDIAAHVAPEIETLLDSLSNLMREARDACNEIWIRWSNLHANSNNGFGIWGHENMNTYTTGPNAPGYVPGNSSNSSSRGDMSPAEKNLTETVFLIFRKREIVKLHSVQGQVAAIHLYLAQKKENFEEMTAAVKIRCVSRNLEQLLEELPVFLLRIEEIMIAFDDRFQWKDFKFCLQLAISQVCQTVHHLQKERDRLQRFLLSLSDLVQRDEFHQSLINLKLLGVPPSESATDDPGSHSESTCLGSENNSRDGATSAKNTENIESQNLKTDGGLLTTGIKNMNLHAHKELPLPGWKDTFGMSSDFATNDLNLVENLCTPKRSKDSILAQNCIELFNSSLQSDMVFEIVQEGEKVEIPSHRVIVAARCDWFRRALLSGMKESIQKRIVIHDSSINVFQMFLKYIYSGQIDLEVTFETLAELIALSDRYEMDTLKLSCEQELAVRHLDENSVIFLLSMADQYNARNLRGACMEYIAANPGIMARELFEELSPELQMEVYDITMWSKPNRKVFSTNDELSSPRYCLIADSQSSSSSSTSSSPTFGRRRHMHSSNSNEASNSNRNLDNDETTPIVSRHHHHHHSHHHHHHHRSHHITGHNNHSSSHSSGNHSHSSHSGHGGHSRSHSHRSHGGSSSTNKHHHGSRSSRESSHTHSNQNHLPSANGQHGHQQQQLQGNESHVTIAISSSVRDNAEGRNANRGNREGGQHAQGGGCPAGSGTGSDTTFSTEDMERCVSQLKDILGDNVPHDQLSRIAMAADLDVNRALNFFFSS